MDHTLVSYLFIFILVFGFGLIAIKHLKYQPFYSCMINNYKFGIYFSYCVFSLFLLLVLAGDLSNSQFLSDISPFIIAILFGLGYKINDIYYKFCINRIYKKFHEKEELINIEELNRSPTKLNKNAIYKSADRISMYTVFPFFYINK